MKKLSIFVTADALLAAVLLVWAQLWINSLDQEKFDINVGIGLVWTYLAVLLSLMALAVVGWKSHRDNIKETPDVALGLFFASLSLAILEVGQSLASVVVKTFIIQSILTRVSTQIPTSLAIFLCSVALVIIGLSIWGVKSSKHKLLPWVLYLSVIFVSIAVSVCVMAYLVYHPPN